MKKTFPFIAVLLLLTGTTALAQLKGGIKFGLNATKQTWSIELTGFGSGSDSFHGESFHAGFYLIHNFTEVVTLQPELLFSQLKVDVEIPQGNETITMNYLSLPVMFGYGVENNLLVFQVGPQLGLLLNSDPSEFKDDDYIRSIDFAFAFGIMVNVKKFNLSLRYAAGISNLAKDKLIRETEAELEAQWGTPIDMDMAIKNNNLQIALGYQLFGK